MSGSGEQVIVVDADNRPSGAVSRSHMREEGLIYRATYILVCNPGGEILLQQRSAGKDMYPSYYDAVAGGVVQAGESYEESAERELEEELGIAETPLERLFDFYFEDPENRVWGRVYRCRYDGPLRLQVEEIDAAFFCPIDRVLDGDFLPLTPDSHYALRCYHSQLSYR
jgi:8-oxo-dGTP pyrophosphatase MutT (NUDIX family)